MLFDHDNWGQKIRAGAMEMRVYGGDIETRMRMARVMNFRSGIMIPERSRGKNEAVFSAERYEFGHLGNV